MCSHYPLPANRSNVVCWSSPKGCSGDKRWDDQALQRCLRSAKTNIEIRMYGNELLCLLKMQAITREMRALCTQSTENRHFF